MKTLRTAFRTLLLAVAGWACAHAQGQAFPSRTVTLVVPWPSGGAADFTARTLAKELESVLGQTVIVDNAVGAGGSLGVAKALRAPVDGHTLLLSSPLDVILAPLSFPGAGYRSEDVRAVALLGQSDLMLVSRKDLGARTLDQLAAQIKAQPDKPLSYCALANGSIHHLIGEHLRALAAVKLLAVPYSGLGPCVNDLIGGRVDLAYLPVAGSYPALVDSNALRALAVFSESAHPRLPEVPTARQTPGFESLVISLWAGVHVHAQVPEATLLRLNEAVNAAMARPEVRQALQGTGVTVFPAMTPAQAQAAYLQTVRQFRAMSLQVTGRKP